jgi:hypothetical protein
MVEPFSIVTALLVIHSLMVHASVQHFQYSYRHPYDSDARFAR